MTQFESFVFDLVESVVGREATIKIYRFCINAAAAFIYLCYLFTLPFKFVKLFWRNLKDRGVI